MQKFIILTFPLRLSKLESAALTVELRGHLKQQKQAGQPAFLIARHLSGEPGKRQGKGGAFGFLSNRPRMTRIVRIGADQIQQNPHLSAASASSAVYYFASENVYFKIERCP